MRRQNRCLSTFVGERGKTVIFLRHGHRTATKAVLGSLCNDVSVEKGVWQGLLPSKQTIEPLERHFPVINHNKFTPVDIKTSPFGCLTKKGLDHMRNQGKCNAGKYFDSVEVMATNFQRTQLSAQSFLSGLFETDMPTTPIPIISTSISECPMSFYDGRRDIARSVIREVQKTDKFVALEEGTASLVQSLTSHFPSLVSASSGKFDWFAAFDYFACRDMHELSIQPQLAGYHEKIVRHVVDRYNLYLSHAGHLACLAHPMLLSLSKGLNVSSLPNQGNSHASNNGNSLLLLSGHDVNILGVLHAIGADLVQNTGGAPYWPDVGTVLRFHCSSNDDKIRVSVNGQMVHVDIARAMDILTGDSDRSKDKTPTGKDFFTHAELLLLLNQMQHVIDRRKASASS